jgi:hypothetical protein
MNTKEIIKSFKQGGIGNCVSIAIIKASIQIFGLNKVFNHQWVDGNCKVLMRDGFELSFTQDEMDTAKIGSEFVNIENSDFFDYAVLCFTAMAKRAQKEENDDVANMTFERAIETLNDGEWYTHGADWLGLRYNTLNIKRKYIWQYKGVVGASRKHCFFCSEGVEDNYGKVDYVNRFEKRFCKWFRVTKEQHY